MVKLVNETKTSKSAVIKTASTPSLKEKKTSVPKKEKKAVVLEKVEISAPEVSPPPVAETNMEIVENTPVDANTALTNSLLEKRNDFNRRLVAVHTLITAMKVDVKAMDKIYDKTIRELLKKNRRKAAKTGSRQPIGFTKPTLISSDLAAFLGLDAKNEISRVEVCKMLYAYIKSNNLQDPSNGRHIVPNDPLRTLLGVKESDDLTYFNLQSFLRIHFVSTKNTLAAANAASAANVAAAAAANAAAMV
jgi:chromatin remodeling complex protein RSC6